MKPRLELAAIAIACAAMGLATGIWLIPHDHGTRAGDEPPAPEAEQSFDAATIESLGIQTHPLERGPFAIERAVAAEIADLPSASRRVYAPIGGVVLDLSVTPGARVDPGAVLLRLQRDAIAPPKLELVREHVFPNHDEIHAAIGALRSAETTIATDEEELARLSTLEASGRAEPLLPRQRGIELGYALRRSRAAAQQARHELERHGFTDAQIEAVLADREAVLFDGAHARRALIHAGLWSPRAQALLETLPDTDRGSPLVVGTVAELTAIGRVDDALIGWLGSSEDAAARFLSVAALLLEGRSTSAVRWLAELGALDDVIELRAPDSDAAWDVPEVFVRPGEPVASAAPLAALRDARRMRLVIAPIGSDLGCLRDAFARGLRCRARSVPAGIAPTLENLVVASLQPSPNGITAWIDVDNPMIARDGAAASHTWSLQPGLDYELLIPTNALDAVWIVPRTAIADHGASRIVFIAEPNGHFHPQPVIVLAEDGERSAIGAPTEGPCELVDGCSIVTSGAYALVLALRGDGDLGHDHDH